MKKYSLNIIFLLAISLGCFITCLAGSATLKWQTPGQTSFGGGLISTCGVANKINFKAGYDAMPPGGVTGPEPYRYEMQLFRDNTMITNYTFRDATTTVSHVFYDIAATPGNYAVRIRFYKHNVFGWQQVDMQDSALVNSSAAAANPDFYISTSVGGPPVTPVGGVIKLNIWQPIILNAANTTCETFYLVNVQENDQWWNKSGKYEFDKWSTGEAVNNVNLQQLAATYSIPPYTVGIPDLTRFGTPLIGGNLTGSSLLRYYRVNVCTNEPTWKCKSELLRINN